MDEFKKIGVKKVDEEARKEKVLDWLWGAEEKRTVLGLLKGKRKKKELFAELQLEKNMNKKAYVLGNGPSRPKDKEWLDSLEGVTYGCNALYRDWEPDFLVANDLSMMLEIITSDYTGTCYFTDYEELPIDAIAGIKYTPGYESAVHIGDQTNSTSFVFIESLYQYYIIWLGTTTRHLNWGLKTQFEKMSTGLCALQLALETGYDEIDVIGFNGLKEENYRNIYDGTENYRFDPATEDKIRVPETYVPLDAKSWKSTYTKLIEKYPEIKINLI